MVNEQLRKERLQRLEKLSSSWNDKAEPVLTRILMDNPCALEKLEYSVPSRLPVVGGSFYNPQTFEYKARKEGDVYFIDKYAGGVPYRKGTNPLSLQRAAEDFSRGLLNRYRHLYQRISKDYSLKIIPRTARKYLISQIKELTGRDLRKDVKEKNEQ